MKRNNDYIVRILSEFRKSKSDDLMQLQVGQFADSPELTGNVLKTYIEFMIENDLIEHDEADIYKITWHGHDFLGFSSDSVMWNVATQVAGHLSFDSFFAVLKELMYWKARKLAEEFSTRENGTKKKNRM